MSTVPRTIAHETYFLSLNYCTCISHTIMLFAEPRSIDGLFICYISQVHKMHFLTVIKMVICSWQVVLCDIIGHYTEFFKPSITLTEEHRDSLQFVHEATNRLYVILI